MVSSPPPGDSPKLALVHPTDSEQHEQILSNSTSWRGALELQSYVGCEQHLANVQLTKDGGITFWVLVDTDESVPHGSNRTVLAGCESLRKRALILADGQLRDATCHGVASVFCPDRFRGRGYGARMIAELGHHLREWQNADGKPQFSVLYSDIGKVFYGKHGWVPYTSSHMHLPPLPSSASITIRVPPSTPLTASDLPPLCALDEELLRSKMSSLISREPGSKPVVALIPDAATLAWHHAREDYVAQTLFNKTPSIKGAQVLIPHPSSPMGKRRAWGVWTRVWQNVDITLTKGNTLHLLRICIEPGSAQDDPESIFVEDTQAVMAIFHQAQRQAAEWGMAEVEVWNPAPATQQAVKLLAQDWSVQGGQGVGEKWGTLIHRDSESICSLKWYDDLLEGNAREQAVEWIENEKFGWS